MNKQKIKQKQVFVNIKLLDWLKYKLKSEQTLLKSYYEEYYFGLQ